MVRLIPPSTKEKSIIVFGMTFLDIIIFFLITGFACLFLLAPFSKDTKTFGFLSFVTFAIIAVMRVNGIKGYQFVFYLLTFWMRKKSIENISLKKECGINFDNNTVNANGKLSKIIEIHGIDFAILPEEKQNEIITRLCHIYKNVKEGSIVKLDRPINFEEYIKEIETKLEMWKKKAKDFLNLSEDGQTEEEAIGIASRIEILQKEQETLEYNQYENKQFVETFYLIIYGISEESINYTVNQCIEYLNRSRIDSHILDHEEVKKFYELYFDKEMNEDNNFVLPNIQEKFNKLLIDGNKYRITTINKVPLFCVNAWLNQVFRLRDTKVVMKFKIENNKQKIYKSINKSLIELRSRYSEKNLRDDQRVDISTQIAGLEELLAQLKLDNESLHTVSFYILHSDADYKAVEEVFKEISIYTDNLAFRQFNSYLAMLPYNPNIYNDPFVEREWQTSTLSATFPFVTKLFMDKNGYYLGESENPVFFNLFASWNKNKSKSTSKRTNANMTVLGKSGNGKTYFMKDLMTGLSAEGKKIICLDPENEYDYNTEILGGNIIDVGGVGGGVINPMQIFPTLRADDSEDDSKGISEISTHRQFLQEFFTIAAPKLENECFAFLNQAIKKVYDQFDIYDHSDITKLKPEDFPIFDDLYEVVNKWEKEETIEYSKTALIKLRNQLEDFRTGGVHARLWNGKTTLVLKNDFSVFNFQSLFSSNNRVVGNAQMLLIMRYLMQEVIKNKNFNELYGTDNNIVILIDEAHQFIDPKFPVALDFMSQMVKRIRKYGGSIIVTTQNVADFVGQSHETKAKATAVINGCQYTMVFGLNPDDVNSMIDLYKSYNGGLTKKEVNLLTDAELGNALFLVDSSTKLSIKIKLYDGLEDYIIRPKTKLNDSEEKEVNNIIALK